MDLSIIIITVFLIIMTLVFLDVITINYRLNKMGYTIKGNIAYPPGYYRETEKKKVLKNRGCSITERLKAI